MIWIILFLLSTIGGSVLLAWYRREQCRKFSAVLNNLSWTQRLIFLKIQYYNKVMSCLELWASVSLEIAKQQPDCNYHYNELMQDVKAMADLEILKLTDEDQTWGGLVTLNYWLNEATFDVA